LLIDAAGGEERRVVVLKFPLLAGTAIFTLPTKHHQEAWLLPQQPLLPVAVVVLLGV
jgi:hypothetical protein